MNARKTPMLPKERAPLDPGALKGIAAGIGAGLLLIVLAQLLAPVAPLPAPRAAPTAAPAPTRAIVPTAAPTAAPTLFPATPGIVGSPPLREVELVTPEPVQQEAAAPAESEFYDVATLPTAEPAFVQAVAEGCNDPAKLEQSALLRTLCEGR